MVDIIKDDYYPDCYSDKMSEDNSSERSSCTDLFVKAMDNSTPAGGLKGLVGKTLQPDPRKQLAATAAEKKNFVIGQRTYVFKEGRAGGVEPKFMAKKAWTEKDMAKMVDDPDHKYHKWAKEKLQEYRELGINHAEIQDRFVSDIKKIISGEIQDEKAQIVFQKFIKTHFIKLDYKDPKLGEIVTRPGMVTSIRNVNLGAVKEALANDLYTLFGVPSQKLTLVESTYNTGQPKLLLKGTEVRGVKGEKFHDFSANIPKFGSKEKREAYLEKNQVVVDGKSVPIDTQELATLQMVTLLFGDRDKFGSEGKNVGFIVSQDKAHIRNIDPGKSFEEAQAFCTDRMNHKNLSNDGSFTQPHQTIENLEHLYYKNLTIASDTALSEKINAMNQILDKYMEALEVVNQYIDKFGGSEHTGEKDPLNFKAELESTKQRLINRVEDFRAVFGERLNMTPDELDLLDNFEKLTSETVSSVTFGKPPREVQLQHLKKVGRVEWQMKEEGGNCVFSTVQAHPAKKISKSVEWLRSQGVDVKLTLSGKKNIIVVTIPKNQVNGMLTEEEIRDFKSKL